MARTIAPFNIRTEFTVDAAKGLSTLAAINKSVNQMSGGFAKGLGGIGIEATKSMGSLKELGGAFKEIGGAFSGLASQIPGLGSAMSAATGPAGILAGTLSALGAAGVTAAAGIFSLTKSFAEAGSVIHDTAQKMGVSAETASVLKFAAEQSGVAFESLARPMAKFSVLIGEAARGSEKASEKLTRFGIDPKAAIADLDGALAKVFKKIHDAPDGVAKMTLAADAFGAKAGATLIPVIETMNGDLKTFSEEARKAGVVMSQADADAADQFGDTLDKLTTQLKFTSYVFAAQFAPVIEDGMARLSRVISENKDVITQWGKNLGDVMQGLAAISKTSTASMIYDWAKFLTLVSPQVALTRKFLEWVRSQGQAAGGTDAGGPMGGRITTTATAASDLDDIFSGKTKKAKKTAAAKDELAPFKSILDQVTRSLQFYGDKTEHAKVQQEFMRAGIEKLTGSTREQAEAMQRLALRTADIFDINKQVADEAKKQADETEKRLKEGDEASLSLLVSQNEEIRQLTFGAKTANDMVEDLIKSQALLGNVVDENRLKFLKWNAAIIDRPKQLESQGKFLDENQPAIPETGRLGAVPGVSGQKIVDMIGEPPKAFSKWDASFKILKDTGAEALHSLGAGMQQLIETWILGGDTAAGSMKKITAAVLAGVAAQSAVLAIFHTAQGIADLFWHPAKAAAEFQAAAMFAVLAVGGGVMGRVLGKGAANDQAVSPTVRFGAGTFTSAPGRARGGPVFRGRPYIVGENQAEVFIPGENGRIHPNAAGYGDQSALLERLTAVLDRFDSMPADHVVMKGARGLTRAYDQDANLIREHGRRFNFA